MPKFKGWDINKNDAPPTFNGQFFIILSTMSLLLLLLLLFLLLLVGLVLVLVIVLVLFFFFLLLLLFLLLSLFYISFFGVLTSQLVGISTSSSCISLYPSSAAETSNLFRISLSSLNVLNLKQTNLQKTVLDQNSGPLGTLE
jgi:hypothetical protein